jgi:hypothetical protein
MDFKGLKIQSTLMQDQFNTILAKQLMQYEPTYIDEIFDIIQLSSQEQIYFKKNGEIQYINLNYGQTKEIKEWFCNGIVIKHFYKYNGVVTGLFKEWYPNEQLRKIALYEDDFPHGEFHFFDKKGGIDKHCFYYQNEFNDSDNGEWSIKEAKVRWGNQSELWIKKNEFSIF